MGVAPVLFGLAAGLAFVACGDAKPEPVALARPPVERGPGPSSSPPPAGSAVAPEPAAKSREPHVECIQHAGTLALRWAPRASRVAVRCDGVDVYDVPSRILLAHADGEFHGFRGDAEGIALRTDDGAALWDLRTRNVRRLAAVPRRARFWMAPDWSRAAFEFHGDVVIVDAGAGATLATLAKAQPAEDGGQGMTESSAVAWSPDGARIAITDDTFVSLWDAITGALLHRWPTPATEFSPRLAGFSADGKTFFATAGISASVRGESNLHAWSVPAWSHRGPWTAPSIAVSTDGRTAYTGAPRVVHRLDLATRARHVLLQDPSEDARYGWSDLALSADGHFLSGAMHMMSGDASEVFETSTGKPSPWMHPSP